MRAAICSTSTSGIGPEALAAAHAITVEPGWSPDAKLTLVRRISIHVAAHLPAERRRHSLEDLLREARALASPVDRLRDLLALAGSRSRPEEREEQRALFVEILELARAEAPTYGGSDLVRVAIELSRARPDLLPLVLAAARGLPDPEHRAEVSSELARALAGAFPVEAITLAGEAMDLTRTLDKGAVAFGIFERLLPFWAPICEALDLSEGEELCAALESCAKAERSEVLAFIEEAAVTLARAGGVDAVRGSAQAILAVTSWWP